MPLLGSRADDDLEGPKTPQGVSRKGCEQNSVVGTGGSSLAGRHWSSFARSCELPGWLVREGQRLHFMDQSRFRTYAAVVGAAR